MKKTKWIKAVGVLFILSFIAEIISLIGVSVFGTQLYYGNYVFLNTIATIFLVLDIILSGIFIYELFFSEKSVIYWTNIVFSFAMLRSAFVIVADIIIDKPTLFANVIEAIFVFIFWMLFVKHLKKNI